MAYYFPCPIPTAPSGGVWFIHRLARLLRDAGREALVVKPEFFEVWWDAHPSPAGRLEMGRYSVGPEDTIIIPETWWDSEIPPQLFEINPARPPQLLMFMQNHIWLNKEYWQAHPGRVLTCSRYLYNWCERELGLAPLGIVTPYLDDDVWGVRPKVRDRVVVFSRRTHAQLIECLLPKLREAGCTVDLIDTPISQHMMASHFDEAEFYLHLVEPEGFPMLALEAMRSGTLVVGTPGGGGNEFMFDRETAMCVAGPTIGKYEGPEQWNTFAALLLLRLQELRANDDLRSKMWQKARNWSLRYNERETARQLLEVFP